jgi:hypothetical protein
VVGEEYESERMSPRGCISKARDLREGKGSVEKCQSVGGGKNELGRE